MSGGWWRDIGSGTTQEFTSLPYNSKPARPLDGSRQHLVYQGGGKAISPGRMIPVLCILYMQMSWKPSICRENLPPRVPIGMLRFRNLVGLPPGIERES